MQGRRFGSSGPALATPAPTPVSIAGRGYQGALEAADGNALQLTPWVLVGFLFLWVIWAVVEQHQRLKAQVQPKNIAINLRNIAAIGLTAVLFYALARVGLVKLRLVLVWLGQRLGGLLGTVVGYLTDLVGALIKVVG